MIVDSPSTCNVTVTADMTSVGYCLEQREVLPDSEADAVCNASKHKQYKLKHG